MAEDDENAGSELTELTEDGFLDVLHNGGLLKKVLRAAKGGRPEIGDTVSVHYVVRLEADTARIVADTRADGAPVRFEAGQGDVEPGLDLVVALMEVGEVALVKMAARYAYGELGRDPDVPPNANLRWEIELLASEPTKPLDELTVGERVEKAERKRKYGNVLFNRKDVEGALTAYARATKILDIGGNSDPQEDAPPADSEARKRTLVLCLSNQAICQWKLGELSAALDSCQRCLALDPTNVKVLYRSATILASQADYEAAGDRISKLLAIDAENAAALALQREIRQQHAAQRKGERALYQRMMQSSTSIYDDKPLGSGASGNSGANAVDHHGPWPSLTRFLRFLRGTMEAYPMNWAMALATALPLLLLLFQQAGWISLVR